MLCTPLTIDGHSTTDGHGSRTVTKAIGQLLDALQGLAGDHFEVIVRQP